MRTARDSFFAAIALALATARTIAGDFHVVDGDTIKSASETYRLEGIDAPEAGQSCASASGETWRCGDDATMKMVALVAGKDVHCETNGKDDYGRWLATCETGGASINGAMVREGLAWAFRKYSMTYVAIEDEARRARRGVWQAETETPWAYRERRWNSAKQITPNGCPIKGNINAKGERIYHTPWSPWYAKARVNTAKGERWFCSEAEALAAGWRAPMWGR